METIDDLKNIKDTSINSKLLYAIATNDKTELDDIKATTVNAKLLKYIAENGISSKDLTLGNVVVEKNTSGGFTIIANRGQDTETSVIFTKEQITGLGIKDISKDDNGDCIVTYTDNTTDNLGQWNGKNATVKVKDNTGLKYTLELTYTDENNVEQKIVTPNLRAVRTWIEIAENSKYAYKLNIIEYDENGNKKLLNSTPNLRSNFTWVGSDLIGDEIVFEVLADDGKSYSRVNDLYLNTDTNDIYRRTDKENVNNYWEKVGNIQGYTGDDAYQVAVKEGFQGTRSEWLKSLMGESLGSQIVWKKPNIHDEETLLKVWYYYKIDNAKYGEGSSWLNRYNIPSDKDYEPSTYSFYNGINYLTFTSTIATIPSMTQKDLYSFYVLYDEQNSKCIVHSVNKTTEEDITLGDWLDITKSSSQPESSKLVVPDGDIVQYGTWVQTIYLGNSKENAYDCTIATGADVSGFITQETFDNVIGSDTLKTDNQKIKSAINEIFDMIKANKSTLLDTQNKSLFEAVNELFKKKYMDCYELKDEDLLAHCLNLGYKTLSCNFIYAENCTNVPKDNNGYGYAMLIISQDTHYRQVIFFDPSNGKISTNNIGANADNTAFGNWSGWDSESDHGVPIGSIQAYYGAYYGLEIPDKWALCDGSVVKDKESPLYGKTLPDLRGRTLFGQDSRDGNFNTLGKTGGKASVQLTKENLPYHRHDEMYNTIRVVAGSLDSWNTNPIPSDVTTRIMWTTHSTFTSGTDFSSGNNDNSNWGRNLMCYGSSTFDTRVLFIDDNFKSVGGVVGNNMSHENLPPYVTTNYIIKIK